VGTIWCNACDKLTGIARLCATCAGATHERHPEHLKKSGGAGSAPICVACYGAASLAVCNDCSANLCAKVCCAFFICVVLFPAFRGAARRSTADAPRGRPPLSLSINTAPTARCLTTQKN
jgi:hypothetical protein